MIKDNKSKQYEEKIKSRTDITFLNWENGYVNNSSRALVKCEKGHIWSASAKNLSNNSGCPRCAGSYHRTKQEQEKRIKEEFGFNFVKWVDEYGNNKSEFHVSCDHGHLFSANLTKLMKGKKCPDCQGAYKYSEKEAKKIVNESGYFSFIKWDDKYNGVMSSVVVSCTKGHKIKTRLTNIIAGFGCNRCNSGWIGKEEREKQLKELKGRFFVKWLTEYKNCFSKAVMMCEYGHIWSSPVMQLIKDTGYCPVCSPHGFNPNLTGTLYLLRSKCGTMMKIGITNSHKDRLLKLRRSTPFDFRCIERFEGEGHFVMKKEKELLNKYEPANLDKKFDGYTEWRKWDNEIILIFKQLQTAPEARNK